MEVKIIKDFPIRLEPDRVKEALQLHGRKGELTDLRELIASAEALAQPRIVYKISYVEARQEGWVRLDGTTFSSRVLGKKLEKAERVFPYIVTIGGGLEENAGCSRDLLRQYLLEGLGDLAVQSAEKHLEQHLKKRFRIRKLSSMNPGSLEDWPITEQRMLFSLFGDVESLIGVRLTSAMLMIPRKSVSGFFFAVEEDFHSCQLCRREKCPSRKAPADENLIKAYGLDEA